MERWKWVVGYEGYYQVSDQGRVRSVDRIVSFEDGRVRRFPGRLLKLKRHNQYGYPLAAICRGPEKRWRTVHQLVMEAFVGPCPPGKEIRHKQRNLRPALSNLRYGTRAENAADMRRHGTVMRGAAHPSAIYSNQLLAKIRRAKGTITEIAARFGVSRTHAWHVRNGKRRAYR